MHSCITTQEQWSNSIKHNSSEGETAISVLKFFLIPVLVQLTSYQLKGNYHEKP